MRISIVTPSRNMLAYLRRCHASIADQTGVETEHLVMDACSTDGTVEWLGARPEIRSTSERDAGMYDAVNKGLAQARGDVLAYLNCDEQYLPGTLAHVAERFERDPTLDMLFGGALQVRPDGSLLAFRKAYPLRWQYIVTSHLYVLSCTVFFRRRLLERGHVFDASLRDVADARFVIGCLRAGARVDYARRYFGAFTMTGQNMSIGENAARETAAIRRTLPAYLRLGRIPVNALRLGEKLLRGAYWERFPLEYALYVDEACTARTTLRAERVSPRWQRV